VFLSLRPPIACLRAFQALTSSGLCPCRLVCPFPLNLTPLQLFGVFQALRYLPVPPGCPCLVCLFSFKSDPPAAVHPGRPGPGGPPPERTLHRGLPPLPHPHQYQQPPAPPPSSLPPLCVCRLPPPPPARTPADPQNVAIAVTPVRRGGAPAPAAGGAQRRHTRPRRGQPGELQGRSRSSSSHRNSSSRQRALRGSREAPTARQGAVRGAGGCSPSASDARLASAQGVPSGLGGSAGAQSGHAAGPALGTTTVSMGTQGYCTVCV